MTIFTAAEALSHGRLADVSVYDRSEGRWLQVYRHAGRMYVEGKPGHEYQIRLANPSQSGYVLSQRGSPCGLLRRAHRQAGAPQISESAPASRAIERDDRLGTGHGRHQHSPARHVTFERATSAPAEIIALYYDSHANLLARGIIREPIHVSPTPRPFPGFVPDPSS